MIEVDGDIHGEQHQVVRDRRRESYLKSLGLQVIRYMNDDIVKNLDGVLEDLYERVA